MLQLLHTITIKMNPNAPEFVPYDSYCEVGITPEDLHELEVVEEWIKLMIQLETAQAEHIKAYALLHAPASVDWGTIDWSKVSTPNHEKR